MARIFDNIDTHRDAVTNPAERTELDGLTEAEFVHIPGTFPLVPRPVKVAAHNAYRDVARGLIQ